MSHTVTLPLLTDTWQEHRIETRFEAVKEVYNAVLGEYLRRLDLLRDSLAYQKQDERADLYREYGLSFTQSEPGDIRRDVIEDDCWIRDHLSANQCDSVAR